MFTFTNSQWLEASFQKRECIKIIPSAKDPTRCCCGLGVNSHQVPLFAPCPPTGVDLPPVVPEVQPGEHWNPAKHTVALPTDAYGCIDFRGTHTNKAQYIRLSYDTKPESVLSLLLREWCLERPKLLITITGGKANFELQPRIKRNLRRGLLKAAKTTGAWIVTGGTNTGVNKHVGDALMSEKSPRIKGGRVVSIGITPWGIVERRAELVGNKKEVAFHPVPQPRSRFAGLNKHHAYFLLVDNGTVGKYGAEIALRRKLEKFISTQSLGGNSKGFSTPLVCLVIEGGTNTIRAVLEYVTATPPVPVVVCDGTGRSADLLAFAHKYAGDDGDFEYLDDMKDELLLTIMKTFSASADMAARLFLELKQCVKRKNLITVYRCSSRGQAKNMELDEVIMTALFKAQHLSPTEQLSLALAWNRCDIATKEIFTYGQIWPRGALERAMFDALENDRVDFVKLLLEQGVNMNKFLTVSVLEDLYNSKNGPANTLDYIVRDVVPRMPRGYRYTLIDIGLVINQLMASGYCATYTRRKFRTAYNEYLHGSSNTASVSPTKSVQGSSTFLVNGNSLIHKSFLSQALRVSSFMSSASKDSTGSNMRNGKSGDSTVTWTNNIDSSPVTQKSEKGNHYRHPMMDSTFDYPFSELIVWSVLTKRQEMAKLMWQNGEQAMAKSLVAFRLYQAMATEAADDDLDVEIYDELTGYAKIFEELSLQLLEYSYQSDDDLTQHLLTASLENWSRQTCLSLAVMAQHLRFLSHPLSQVILADLWMGGLRMRKNPGFKIFLGLLFPPTIAKLEFKTREELELMPQTEEELQDRDDSDSNSSASSSSTSSRRSSLQGNDFDSLSSLEMGGKRSGKRAKTDTEEDGDRVNSKMYHTSTSVTTDNDDGILINDMPNYGANGAIDFITKKKTRPLKLKKKLYEFYAAPITKYFCHSIAYAIFLAVYTYICLVKTPMRPSWPEMYVVACMLNYGAEKIRQLVATEPTDGFEKLRVWLSDTRWNLFDAIAIVIFLSAFGMRLYDDVTLVPFARVTYSTVICYWYIRSLRLIGVNKYFGPFVMMIGKMIENMIYFVVLLLVVLMAFGVCRQSILYPNEEPHWRLVRHIFYQPYFMLYGEVFAPDIDPECNPDCDNYGECGEAADGSLLVPCGVGRWITPIVMTIYLLVANILLINLLIASFNTIYNSVNAMSHQFWNFQRFSVVIEYEEKPTLPAPLTFLSHIHRICKYVHRQCKGINPRFESGLKLFLSKFDLERLYDFEEECVEGMMRGKENFTQHSTDVRVKNIFDMMEEVKGKVDDLDRWETVNQEANQNMEDRLQRLENIAQQTASHLAVIHRFMATQGGEATSLTEPLRPGSSQQPPLPPHESDDGQDGGEGGGITERVKKISISSGRLPTGLSSSVAMELQAVVDSAAAHIALPRHDTAESELVLYHTEEVIHDTIPLARGSEDSSSEDKVRFSIEDQADEEDKNKPTEPEEPTVRLEEGEKGPEVVEETRPEAEEPKSEQVIARRASVSSASKGAKPKQTKSKRRGSSMKIRHVSSGGSSIDAVQKQKSKLAGSKTRRPRWPTESSTGNEEDVGAKDPRASLGRQRHVSNEESVQDLEEHYDEFDVLAGVRDTRTRKYSGRGYFRTNSENAPTSATTITTTGSIGSQSDIDEDGSEAYKRQRRASLAISKRLRIHGRRRDYTSITDELELMIATSPPAGMVPVDSTACLQTLATTQVPPAIQIEAECLHNAEDADYNLMESIIHRRLRRDSYNLQASFEDLVTRSIREENSSQHGSEHEVDVHALPVDDVPPQSVTEDHAIQTGVEPEPEADMHEELEIKVVRKEVVILPAEEDKGDEDKGNEEAETKC